MKESTELAQNVMEDSDGDVLAATERLEKMARKDVEIWQALTEGLLRNACYDACRAVCRADRRQIWYSPNYDAGGNGDRVKTHSASLMDLPLPGGKKLRDATKGDLLEASGFYLRQAAQMRGVADFFAAIAERVKRKTVGNTLTEADLRALKDGALLQDAA